MIIVLLALAAAAHALPYAADNLACEHSTSATPFSIDTPFPRLQWTPGAASRFACICLFLFIPGFIFIVCVRGQRSCMHTSEWYD